MVTSTKTHRRPRLMSYSASNSCQGPEGDEKAETEFKSDSEYHPKDANGDRLHKRLRCDPIDRHPCENQNKDAKHDCADDMGCAACHAKFQYADTERAVGDSDQCQTSPHH